MLMAARNSRQFRLTMKEFLSFRGARRGKSIRTAGNYYRRPVGAPSSRGFNFPPTFLDLLLELGGVERITFSADHPYQSMAQARAFLEQLPISASDKERIVHGNADRLFN